MFLLKPNKTSPQKLLGKRTKNKTFNQKFDKFRRSTKLRLLNEVTE